MFKSIASKAAAIGAAGFVVLASSVAVPAFADTPSDSAGAFWIADGNTGAPVTKGSTLQWNDGVIAIPVKDDYDALFQGSADAESVAVFLAPVGKEKTISAWSAYAPSGFNNGSKNVLQPTATLGSLVNGNGLAVKAAGGEYSVGLAFLKNNGLTMANAGIYYTRVHIQPGGAYTFDTPTDSTTPTNPPAGSTSGSVDVSATTTAAVDGALELSVPAGAKATLGTAALVNGLSTSTGKLGSITIKDGRVASTPGWDLTSAVAKFALTGGTSADDIDAKQLGVRPLVTSGPAAAAAGNSAGTAGDNKFASAAAGTSGTSVVDADLTFVAPAKSKAGTYTSKVTLTLVSK
ncbi:hypothetical protein [Schumannella soli]|uniref:WxL domain-containing protein n=1 Tax=Schumannella soli TaxID=2590779 RepID=A0A506Y572_9MICO|nr:hypothetical protein [Schumannella soli]TPW77142.1 hypothetical protein FJ657_00040 [Schumannella soli]